MLMFTTFGITIFLSVVFVSNNPSIQIKDSLSTVFLIFYACISIGLKANFLQDMMKVSQAINWIFSHIKLEDEHEILIKSGSKQI